MALSTRVPSTAVTNLFVPKIYLNKVIDAAKSNLVCLDAVNSEWVSGAMKGDTFYIPKTNTVTASEVVINTKGTALNPFNTTGVTLTIDQWWQAPVDIDYMTKFQSQLAMDAYAVKEAAYAVRVKIDSTIASLFSTLNGSTVLGTDGSAITDTLLESIVETLDEADVPDENRSLLLDPSAIADMFKFDKYISGLYVTLGAVANGIIANNHPVYGCAVRKTNNLTAATTGSYACMLHKDAIAAKIQMDTAWKKEFEELHTTRYHAEGLWGVIEAQDAFGIPFYTRKL